MNERELLETTSKLLYRRNLITGPGGNLSTRRDDGSILITPTGYLLAEMTQDVLVEVGKDGAHSDQGTQPSSEYKIHLGLYERFPESKAIIHAHPPTVLAMSATDIDFNTGVTADMAYYGNKVTVIECSPAGEFDERVLDAETPIIVVRTHGILIAGRSMSEAFHLTELLETYAKCLFMSKLVGVAHTVPAQYMKEWSKEVPGTVFRDECLQGIL